MWNSRQFKNYLHQQNRIFPYNHFRKLIITKFLLDCSQDQTHCWMKKTLPSSTNLSLHHFSTFFFFFKIRTNSKPYKPFTRKKKRRKRKGKKKPQKIAHTPKPNQPIKQQQNKHPTGRKQLKGRMILRSCIQTK